MHPHQAPVAAAFFDYHAAIAATAEPRLLRLRGWSIAQGHQFAFWAADAIFWPIVAHRCPWRQGAEHERQRGRSQDRGHRGHFEFLSHLDFLCELRPTRGIGAMWAPRRGRREHRGVPSRSITQPRIRRATPSN